MNEESSGDGEKFILQLKNETHFASSCSAQNILPSFFGATSDLWQPGLVPSYYRIIDRVHQCRLVVPGGARGAMAPPNFGISVNPISTRGVDYAPTSLLAPPDFQTFLRSCSYYTYIWYILLGGRISDMSKNYYKILLLSLPYGRFV